MEPLDEKTANAVYDILVSLGGASQEDDRRQGFVWSQTQNVIPEYRFMGKFGFGGKFWRNHGPLTSEESSFGEIWYVNMYHEDRTAPRHLAAMACNDALSPLADEWRNR